jgi:mRNA (guanine-N7-)-methyltransferase
MAAEYGLHPVYKADFGTFQQDHAEHAEYGPLLVRMKVLDENHETTMTQEQWEAASSYPFHDYIVMLADL